MRTDQLHCSKAKRPRLSALISRELSKYGIEIPDWKDALPIHKGAIINYRKRARKNVNKASVAKTVETCASRNAHWLIYAGRGNHPSLDKFKEENGFTKFQITRYYIPLTRKGKIATILGLERDIKDVLPQPIKYSLIPICH